MGSKKVLRIAFLIILFFGVAHTAYSQPPPASSPLSGRFELQEQPRATLEPARQFAEAIDSPKNVVDSLASIPWIGVVTPRLDYPFFEDAYGSAVMVRTNAEDVTFVFTAAHVFPQYQALICGKGSRAELHFHGGQVLAQVVYLNRATDIAILRLEQGAVSPASALKIAEKDPAPGEELFAIGYPPMSASLQTVIKVRYRGIDVRTGQIQTAPHVFIPIAVQYFILWTGAEVGYSGGPLVNKNGEVVGILTQLSPHGSFMLATARKHLLDALSEAQTGPEFCNK